MDFIHPVASEKISSGYGFRKDPFDKKIKWHKGIDYAVPTGTKVFPSLGGIVESVENSPSYGLKIVLNHGNGIKTLYAHLERSLVNINDYVNQDIPIALSGNSGTSTGSHLHFEIFINSNTVDPKKYLKLPPKTNQPTNQPTKNYIPLIFIGGIFFYLFK
jgi:murein DD-endopeptidase MepM/ murein hydrolase activator NlpD